MDKKKCIKEEKVGSDGLTKKERRALKVQAKQTDDNKAELKINKEKEASSDNKEKNMIPPTESPSKAQTADGLSEKQKRKLEWEKKQAEQGNLEKKDSKEGLTKAELKAKRREIQEAQRQAKMKGEAEKSKESKKTEGNEEKSNTANENKIDTASQDAQLIEKFESLEIKNESFGLFDDLVAGNNHFKPKHEMYPPVLRDVDYVFVELGIFYSSKTLSANEKTSCFINAMKQFVSNLITPSGVEFCVHLEAALDKCIRFLDERKHMTLYLLNVVKSFRKNLMLLDKNSTNEEKVSQLLEYLDTFAQEQIVKAEISIGLKVQEKLFTGDNVLVYGWSPTICNIIIDIHKKGEKEISVLIIDSRPNYGADTLMHKLHELGVRYEYIMFNGLSHVMPTVSKVLLEADALMTNGHVVSKAGTAQICKMAQEYNKPVLLICESYKFTECNKADSIFDNVTGLPDTVLGNIPTDVGPLEAEKNDVNVYNCMYNFTPPGLVTLVITELATLLQSTAVLYACRTPKVRDM